MSFPLHPAISLVVNHRACSSEGGRRRKDGGAGVVEGEAVSDFSGAVPGNRLLHDCARAGKKSEGRGCGVEEKVHLSTMSC